MTSRTIINVVSGKGGTGKTLFCAVLAEMLGNSGVHVVAVDLDVFVRGLTALLYFHKREALRLTAESELAVADLFIGKVRSLPDLDGRRLGISRYRSFDVLPSVRQIDQVLRSKDIGPDTRDEAEDILRAMLLALPKEYAIVILDSRAGYDELIAATHRVSDISIVVEEDDNISRITADNLIAQLREDSRTPLFRVTNKARGATRPKDLDAPSRGIGDLGRIPFDGDVMKSFGSDTFWEEISRSLYQLSVSQVWNRLAVKADLPQEMRVSRMSPLGSSALERYFSVFALRDRVLLIYSALITITGLGYALLGRQWLAELAVDPMRLTAFATGVLGFGAVIYLASRAGKR